MSEYDLESAKVLYQGKRYLTMAFSCQQSIEKILKALFVKQKNETPPYTHNLIRLEALLDFADPIDPVKLGFLEEINSYYIETRYTEELSEMSDILTDEKSLELLEKTEGILQWLKKQI